MTDRFEDVAAETLDWELQVGYATRAQLLEAVADALEGDDDVERGELEALVDEALAARAADEATWEDPTDHDRLLAALAELDARGIVAREDFGATIKDAEREVADEAARQEAAGRAARGTCTFNRQDAEGAAGGGLLFLSFAAYPRRGPDGDAAIGAEVTDTLRRHELGVEWNGQAAERIGVQIPDWRVRRATANLARVSRHGWGDIWTDPEPVEAD